MPSKFLLFVVLLFAQQLSAQITAYTVCFDDYCDGDGLENMSLELTLATSPVTTLQYAFTGVNGCATFNTAAIPVDSVITILADGNPDPLNGISTYDLLAFQKHLTGEQPFTEIYQWIAADVNLDKVVDMTDYVILQNMVTGTLTEFPEVQFRFFPKTFVFTHPATPLVDPIPDNVLKFVNGAPADLNLWSVQLGRVGRTGCLAASASEDIAIQLPVKIFPNPASETMHVRAGGNAEEKTYILTDVLGHNIYEFTTGSGSVDIPVGGLHGGIYGLNILQKGRVINVSKVVIGY